MSNSVLTDAATDLIYREGLYLDRQQWQDWLGLYREDAIFWVPAWKSEHQQIEDPDREVSLIYHGSRVSLEERVLRIESNKSITAIPLPRTTHFVTNVLVSEGGDGTIDSTASWSVRLYDPRTARQHELFGRYEHRFARVGGEWRIIRKKVILMNDRIPTMLDFYSV